MKLYEAEIIARNIIGELKPYCDTVEIAGSIRRKKPEVKDIEICCIPKKQKAGFWDEFTYPVALPNFGKMLKGGDRYRQFDLGVINLDLFVVLPPAQWGVIFTIRTGSAEFSHRLVTLRKYGGLLPSNMKVQDGQLFCSGELISTPSETDFFEAIGIDWIIPEERVR